MALCGRSYSEETPEVKEIRKKDQEIERLKDVIVYQAKELQGAQFDYQEVLVYNTELRDARDQLRRELDDISGGVSEIKKLLRLAQECADDTTKSKRQRDVSKIRVELLNDVIDILEGGRNEEKRYETRKSL